jgi:hypothetical protein
MIMYRNKSVMHQLLLTNDGFRALTISNLESSAYGLSLCFLCKA